MSAGFYDIFLAEFDAAGGLRWTRQVGSSDDELAYGVAIDAQGNIYATGYSSATLMVRGNHCA